MEEKYDFVYLTNSPSFYKLNLFNEIGKNASILLVFYGYDSQAVNRDLTKGRIWNFDYCFLYDGDIEDRNILKTFLRLLKLMGKINVKKVLFAGWMAPEYNIYSFLSRKSRNVIVCESTIFDVSFAGIKGILKKMVIHRMSAALPSGKPHDRIFTLLGYNIKRNITGSVGIIPKPKRPVEHHKNSPFRYLYVGRLVPVKNLEFLIRAFNGNGKLLTIVGKGPQEAELKRIAKNNITFIGFVNNDEIGSIYQNHDVFILPSYSETWGLVVEEAIYWGLPVIVSDVVGSSEDMVADLGTGLIFKTNDIKDFQNAINNMEANYENYYNAVMKVDFEKRDKNQIQAYLDLLR